MIRDKNSCWGPIGRLTDGEKPTIRCIDGNRYCTFYINNWCSHQKRALDNPHDTPEWCEMRDDMVAEIESELHRKGKSNAAA